MMNVTNFKLIALILIEDHLTKIVNGEIRMNVANQFDPTVCESAVEVLSDSKYDADVEKVMDLFKNADMNNVSAMSLAHSLSKFEAPELDSAWID